MKIQELREEDIPDAAGIFVSSYEEQVSLVPRKGALYQEVVAALTNKQDRCGYGAYEGEKLVGYMIETGLSENFMGKRTAFSLGLYSHSSVEKNRERIYQMLYGKLSQSWVERGYHAHVFSFWARQDVLLFTLFRLGFGMTHFELIRDLSYPVGKTMEISVRRLKSALPIEDLERDHKDHYQRAPLFWVAEGDDSFNEEFEGCLLGAFRGDDIVAYMHLKINEAETPILASEDTCRVASAYTDPGHRGIGIGSSLLREAVKWAKENGVERLYVEGESANVEGGNFWFKHFSPVVYTVRRCVDERIL